jgi:SagB-type dehydrogenase family enzyme
MNKSEIVINYHERTKHHFNRLARSLGYLDWANQPNPFRFYEGVENIEMPLIKKDPELPYENLYIKTEKVQKFNIFTVSKFLELALGLSAWKSIPGSQWSLRMNPSSGNLHPTESYLLIPFQDLEGIYHYNPLLHNLEKIANINKEIFPLIKRHFKTEGFLIGLSSIFWREAWKYGERAYRYCNHDVGHAVASIRFSANLLGWDVKILNGALDKDISTIFGLDKRKWVKDEEEFPEIVCFIYKNSPENIPDTLPEELIKILENTEFLGKPNRLSEEHVRWDVIYEVAEAAEKSVAKKEKVSLKKEEIEFTELSDFKASEIIRKRRSAVAYDRRAFMDKEVFLSILDKTLERAEISPFDVELNEPQINLAVFVHRVSGLEQGLYFYVRNKELFEIFKEITTNQFLWEEVSPNLFLLYRDNFETTAKLVSCRQDIAGDSCFSLGMVGYFKPNILEEPFSYRYLHYEAGMVGQVLYLEAEAHNFRGTGIGCFFDDAVHEILGLPDNTFQTIYHFTVGKHLEDTRLRTLPPYYHLPENRFVDFYES